MHVMRPTNAFMRTCKSKKTTHHIACISLYIYFMDRVKWDLLMQSCIHASLSQQSIEHYYNNNIASYISQHLTSSHDLNVNTCMHNIDLHNPNNSASNPHTCIIIQSCRDSSIFKRRRKNSNAYFLKTSTTINECT